MQQDIAERAQDEVNLSTEQLEVKNDVYEAAIPKNQVFRMKKNAAYETVSLPEKHDDGDYENITL